MNERELFDFFMQAANLFFWFGAVFGAGVGVLVMHLLTAVANWLDAWPERAAAKAKAARP